MARIAPLADLGDTDSGGADLFGAKAVNLARLARRGLPVPDGFAIAFDPGHMPPLEPEERAAILSAYADLCARAARGAPAPVAVRSSAASEDGAELSFAGLYDTRLGVDESALIDAVEGCLASQRSERADSYRLAAGASVGAMGVLVQLMVAADYAGVCFTRSPLADEEIALEVIEGLGEGLVSGTQPPARVALLRGSLTPRVDADPDGGFIRFGAERAQEAARLCLDVENAFGHPVDVEWAFADGCFALLQARPITVAASDAFALSDEHRQHEILRLRRIAERAGEVIVWTDFSVADMLPKPAPLDLEIMNLLSLDGGSFERSLRALGLRYAASERFGDHYPAIAGRTFLNVSAALDSFADSFPIAIDVRELSFADGRSLDLEQVPVRFAWRGWRSALRLTAALPRLVFIVPVRFFRMRKRFDVEFRRSVEPAVTAEAARMRSLDLSALSSAELWSTFRSRVHRFVELHYYHQLTDSIAFPTHFLLRRNLRRLYGDAIDSAEIDLTTALPGNFNTETNLDLVRTARGELPLDDFLERYGHRGNPDYEISAPRWREEPERVEAMANAIARSGNDPLQQFESQRRVRAEAEVRLSADIRRDRWLRPWHDAILRELRYYQRYSPLREGTQGICYHFIELARRALLEAAGRLEIGELVFFLELEEIERLLVGSFDSQRRVAELVDRARERREQLRAARRLYMPHALRSDDLEAIGRVPALARDVTELSGQAVSAGVVRGRARVVKSLDEARELRSGEILVTASADPSWTPLFLVAGGLVLEQGGLLSHPAIVAREHGLPAIVNVPDATRLLHTGQEITVDANAGRVLLSGA